MNFKMTAIAAAVTFALAAPAHAEQKQQSQSGKQHSQSSSQGSSQAQGEQQKGVVSVSGKVMGNTDIKTTAGDLHRVVKVQTSDGRNVVVDLGVGGPLVNKGDRIFVTGRSARISDKPVIFARYAGKLEEVGQRQQTAASGAGSSGSSGSSAGSSSGSSAGASSASAGLDWTDPNWISDDYGYYDENLAWTADNSGFTSFYGDADDSWGDAYDDVGDEGWFDV